MHRDYRPDELESWADRHGVAERLETAMASIQRSNRKSIAAKADRVFRKSRSTMVPYQDVELVGQQLLAETLITRPELDALLAITEFDKSLTDRRFLADNIVQRREEVATYRDNARRFKEIAAANEPSKALPERLQRFIASDRMSLYGDQSLTDGEVAAITRCQLCDRSKKSVRAELGEMAIAEASLKQLEAELASLAGNNAESDIEAAMVRVENARAAAR